MVFFFSRVILAEHWQPLDGALMTCQWGAHWLDSLLSRDNGVLVHGVSLGHDNLARKETLDEGID